MEVTIRNGNDGTEFTSDLETVLCLLNTDYKNKYYLCRVSSNKSEYYEPTADKQPRIYFYYDELRISVVLTVIDKKELMTFCELGATVTVGRWCNQKDLSWC